MAEVKYKYNLGTNDLFDDVGNTPQLSGLFYLPRGYSQYKVNKEGSDTTGYTTNFARLFSPEIIFPDTQGTESVGEFIGNKFKWLNTMIDIEFSPRNFLTIYGTPTTKMVASTMTQAAQNETGEITTFVTEGQKAFNAGVVANADIKVNTTSTPGTDVLKMNPIEVATSAMNIHGIMRTGEQYQRASQMALAVIAENNSFEQIAISTASMPLLMSPVFKPYFYTRIVIVRLNMSFADWMRIRDSSTEWANFLNALWWSRTDGPAGNPRPYMSQRCNDYNVTNPYGGMFDIIFNKKFKINPFKEFRLRYNLQSRRRGGDLITIKTTNPLVPVPTSGKVMYNHGLYVGLMLGPLCMQDFDPVTQQYILSQSPYLPDAPADQRKVFYRPSIQSQNIVALPWLNPAFNIPNYGAVGTSLKLGDLRLAFRTAYLD